MAPVFAAVNTVNSDVTKVAEAAKTINEMIDLATAAADEASFTADLYAALDGKTKLEIPGEEEEST